MRIILLTISIIAFSALATAQENEKKTKEAKPKVQIAVEDDHDARIQMLQNEIKDTERRLKEMHTAIVPKDELARSIHQTKIAELEFHKKWKQKELSVARSEKAGNDVSGLRGEADAFKERYTAMRDKRVQLEKEAAAKKAEMGDETPIDNTKLNMQMSKLKDEMQMKKKALNREQNSPNPDAERIAQLKGEIEALQRQVDELKE